MHDGHLRAEQLWLEIPPISTSAPRRLLVFLHGAGSSPEAFAPVAIAWQLKFPGATVAVVEALQPSPASSGKDWYDARGTSASHRPAIAAAADEVARRIVAAQTDCEVGGDATVLIGFSQGATVGLELVRRSPGAAAILVAYAGRLARPLREGERIGATVHLIHGELDTVVPLADSQRSYRHLLAAGAEVTLDIALDEGHSLGQSMVSLGSTRVLQTLFRGRTPRRRPRPSPGPETLQ